MNVKTATYQRVKNLGNYESKRLEITIEIDQPLSFADSEVFALMEFVEQKIMEDHESSLRERIKELKQEKQKLEESIKELSAPIPNDYPEDDDTEEEF
ncbi:MAG: hypothetical protein EAZ76_10830 [Nostocales cyanobacterium]|nr:MAG: hypothetical protein EAZ87_11855 [Nostocales cyanobacterium]TAF13795.1 MAG: hypothetical protein EAZ76_10830 [Nostocales cyanobacterium]